VGIAPTRKRNDFREDENRILFPRADVGGYGFCKCALYIHEKSLVIFSLIINTSRKSSRYRIRVDDALSGSNRRKSQTTLDRSVDNALSNRGYLLPNDFALFD